MPRKKNCKLLALRAKTLVARYYYWTDLWDKKYEKVIDILENQEFFIAGLTIERVIAKHDVYLNELRKRKPTLCELRNLFPGFNWKESMTLTNHKRKTVKSL